MTKLTALADDVLKLDAGSDSPWHEYSQFIIEKDKKYGALFEAGNAGDNDMKLVAHYRSSAPALARAVIILARKFKECCRCYEADGPDDGVEYKCDVCYALEDVEKVLEGE